MNNILITKEIIEKIVKNFNKLSIQKKDINKIYFINLNNYSTDVLFITFKNFFNNPESIFPNNIINSIRARKDRIEMFQKIMQEYIYCIINELDISIDEISKKINLPKETLKDYLHNITLYLPKKIEYYNTNILEINSVLDIDLTIEEQDYIFKNGLNKQSNYPNKNIEKIIDDFHCKKDNYTKTMYNYQKEIGKKLITELNINSNILEILIKNNVYTVGDIITLKKTDLNKIGIRVNISNNEVIYSYNAKYLIELIHSLGYKFLDETFDLNNLKNNKEIFETINYKNQINIILRENNAIRKKIEEKEKLLSKYKKILNEKEKLLEQENYLDLEIEKFKKL